MGSGRVWGVVLVWCSVWASSAAWAQQTHATPNAPAAQGGGAGQPGWSGRQFANEQPLYKGALSGLAKKTVTMADKKTVTVGELSKGLFKDQQQVEVELKRAPAGALYGAVKVEEVGYEYAHAYVLTRTVSAVVADPAKLRGASPTFAKIAPKPKGQMSIKDLKPEAQQRFFQIKGKLLADGEPGTDPLKVAAAAGDQALLDAAVEGAGPLSLTDSFMILKVSVAVDAQGRIMAPQFGAGVYDLSKRAPIGAGVLAQPQVQFVTLPPAQTQGGVVNLRTQHLNGFTRGHDWYWDRRWEFFSGHVWLAAGLAYGFGLRMPIELEALMQPTVISTQGAQDQPSQFDVTVKGKTLDGDRDFFLRSGLGGSFARNGEEFLLFAELGYGYSFEALWMSFGERPYSTYGFDFSQHFKPPQSGGWEAIKEYFIPASLTHTALDLGVVKGQVELGVRLDGRGWVDVAVQLLRNGQAESSTLDGGNRATKHMLRLDSPSKQQRYWMSLGVGSPGETTFGFLIDSIRYTAELSVLPGLKYGVTIGYKWVSKSFSDTLWFESLRVVLPSLTLETHAGTRAEVRYEGGKKVYRRTAAD